MAKIEIKCKGSDTLPYGDLTELQGPLKSLSKENYDKLKKQILELGFSSPVHIWKSGKKNYILDGHQRLRVIRKMASEEGYTVPDLPVVMVEAKTMTEAKKKLLALASQFGSVEREGLYEFMSEADFGFEDIEDFHFPEIPFESFRDEYERDPEVKTEPEVEPEKSDEQIEAESVEAATKAGMKRTLLSGDCLEQLKTLPDNSIDSLVTDPPAGISFMGKSWDDDKGGAKKWIAWLSEVSTEIKRVLKPGAHGLVWALPRTSHWTATALEQSGFEIRDVVTHLFGSGFPKSHNLGDGFGTALKPSSERWILCQKPILSEGSLEKTDMSNAQEWAETFLSIEMLWKNIWDAIFVEKNTSTIKTVTDLITASKTLSLLISGTMHRVTLDKKTLQNGVKLNVSAVVKDLKNADSILSDLITISAQDNASKIADISARLTNKWQNKGTEIKMVPSAENFLLIRKPCSEKTVADNVLKWGCGGINIDESRVDSIGDHKRPFQPTNNSRNVFGKQTGFYPSNSSGRFPSNCILSHHPECEEACHPECPVKMLDEQSGELKSGGQKLHSGSKNATNNIKFAFGCVTSSYSGETGGASRFFKCFKEAPCGDVHTVETNLSQIKKLVNSVQDLVATKVNLGGNLLSDSLQVFTSEIQKRLKRNIGIDIKMIPVIAEKFLLELLLIERVNLDHARYVERSKLIDTMMTILDLSTYNGYAANVISLNTSTNTDLGERASRFAYVAKPSRAERNEGCENNPHPTVKSIKLMQYLITMITPPQGTVLDCFMGSGTTGVACADKFHFIGIEKEAEYFNIAKNRMKLDKIEQENNSGI